VRARAAILIALCGCGSIPGSPEWLVDRQRVLAVAAEPPEVMPGQPATFRALYAGPQGEVDASFAQWDPCTAPLPLTETGAVAAACVSDPGVAATGSAVQLATASDACSRFGPIPSPESQRAREPDATGGYYQPMRVALTGAIAFDEERLRCPLAQASFQVAQQYEQTYALNHNPVIELLAASAPLASVPAGAEVALSLSWTADSVETFPLFDPVSFTLVDQQETMSVSWFATSGTLRDARTGGSGTSTSTVWTAPRTAGTVYLWAVLRDSRGGAAWTSATAIVSP
jgi:hypothetical protein